MGATGQFVADIVVPLLGVDPELEDGFRTEPISAPRGMVLTTDLFTVDPVQFPGGSLGTIAASGTINDLVASGARPVYATLGLLASETVDAQVLYRCLKDLADLFAENGVQVVCGDTKTHQYPEPMLVFSMSGLGIPVHEEPLSLSMAQHGDDLWITGPLGGHSIAVLSAREGLGFERGVVSDCIPLAHAVLPLVERRWIHAARDLTRGGLVAAAADGVRATGTAWLFQYEAIRVPIQVRAASEMLGLDPLALTNEGSMLVAAPPAHRAAIGDHLAQFPETAQAQVVGSVTAEPSHTAWLERDGTVLAMPLADGLGIPRLC
ncbi:MAG: AIR synthase-related protein [Micrococcales bacterium]|nr:AIR synthase-related protein [Micrococcales bacterium]MCL2668925.1 AIR synthase-related protein [Micrococcales bacterium]